MKRDELKYINRLVVKVGTNAIMESNNRVNLRQLDRIAYVLTALAHKDLDIILVTSGAITVGSQVLKESSYPQTIPEQQAASSVGQAALMTLYRQFFGNYDQQVGQILYTKDIYDYPKSHENMQNTLNTLLQKKIIPIINENDAVSVEEMNHETKFGDNDTLSALVAKTVNADLLIILSDVAGLYDDNPAKNPEAKLIEEVSKIDDTILKMANGKGSNFSKGGMYTKLKAARIMLGFDKSMVIASAESPDILFDIIEGKNIGTLFTKESQGGKQWKTIVN